jgi:hypothetical protein
MYATDGYKNGEINNNTIQINQKGKISIQGLYYLLKSIGYNKLIIRIRDDKPDVFLLRCYGSNNSIKSLTVIKKILLKTHTDIDETYELVLNLSVDTKDKYTSYVYDI